MARPRTAARPLAVVSLWLVASGAAFGVPGSHPPLAPIADGESSQPTAADAAGIRWRDLSIDEALAEARRAHKSVLLDVWADWCGPCKLQNKEIWSRETGRLLGAQTIPVHIDFESPEGQAAKRRFNVIGLPCVIVLDDRGLEVDRVTGYEGAEAWLEQVRSLIDGVDPLPALEAKLAAQGQSAELLLQIARRRLQRGDETGAFRDFLHLLALAPGEEIEGEVCFLMGRYWQRVREKPAAALPYWNHLAVRLGGTSYRDGAVYWALEAYREMGRTEEGLRWAGALSDTAPDDADLHYVIASWAAEKKVLEASPLAHARAAKRLGSEAPDLDTVIAALEGKPTP